MSNYRTDRKTGNATKCSVRARNGLRTIQADKSMTLIFSSKQELEPESSGRSISGESCLKPSNDLQQEIPLFSEETQLPNTHNSYTNRWLQTQPLFDIMQVSSFSALSGFVR